MTDLSTDLIVQRERTQSLMLRLREVDETHFLIRLWDGDDEAFARQYPHELWYFQWEMFAKDCETVLRMKGESLPRAYSSLFS